MAFERKKELYDLKLVTASEFQDASADYKRAEVEYQQLLTNYTGRGVEVRSPVNGYVKRVEARNGEFVQAGQPLIIVNSDVRGMIQLPVAHDQVEQVGQTRGIWIRVDDMFRYVSGKVASVSQAVSPDEPMLSVFLEVDPPVSVVEGALAEVQLIYGVGEKGILVPRSALLEEFGQYSVIVQLGGEEFERRKVRTGAVNGDKIAITDGLLPGEWVVSKGAYQVSMAALTGAVPDHGHVH
jgi:RND family efflux transporter MFP subunit